MSQPSSVNAPTKTPLKVNLIVAVARNGVIGRDNDLPWKLAADLQRFKRITMGHPIIMGRKTYESIGRPLPGRINMVLSRQAGFEAPKGCQAATGIEAALEALQQQGIDEVFLIGGADLYQQALPLVTHVHLTEVQAEPEGDATFPLEALQTLNGDWVETARERLPADAKNDYPQVYRVLERCA